MIYDLPIEIDTDINGCFADLPQLVSGPDFDYKINYNTTYLISQEQGPSIELNQHQLPEINNCVNFYCYVVMLDEDLYAIATVGPDGHSHPSWCLAWGLMDLGLDLPLSLRLFDVDPPAFIPVKKVLEISEAYRKTLNWVSEDIRDQLDRLKNIGSAVCERWT